MVGYLDLGTLLATGGGDQRYYEMAEKLEASIRKKIVSENLADVTRLYCALSYAICGEYAYKKIIEDIRRTGARYFALDELLSPSAKAEFADMLVRYCNEEAIIPGVKIKLATYDTHYDPARTLPGWD